MTFRAALIPMPFSAPSRLNPKPFLCFEGRMRKRDVLPRSEGLRVSVLTHRNEVADPWGVLLMFQMTPAQ